MNIVYSITALVLTLASVSQIFLSWKKLIPSELRSIFILFGWLGLALALLAWCQTVGVEIGIIIGLCLPTIVAWLLVLKNVTLRQPNSSRKKNEKLDNKTFRRFSYEAWPKILQHIYRLFIMIILAPIASISFAVALTKVFNFYIENAMAFSVLILPCIWGITAWWTAADDHCWRPASGLTTISIISILIISL